MFWKTTLSFVVFSYFTTAHAMLTITIPETTKISESYTTPTPHNQLHKSLRPANQKQFDRIPFLNFKNKQKLTTLCSVQRALEEHKPYRTVSDLSKKGQECINESLCDHQKKLIVLLSTLQQASITPLKPSPKSFNRALKFLALMKTLHRRANKNFISPRYNINAQYQSIIRSTEHTIETTIKHMMPVTLSQDLLETDNLSASCTLLDKLLYYHKMMTVFTNIHRNFAINTVHTMMRQNKKL